ncbi:SRPBCC domain-containing protein [Corynebacterium sp. L4756]|uniref:SRPBCC domain-containing protein n=1 Tax=unclassified Corynebacterium TaxID=2624378 RepID=UPI00374D0ED8
MNANTRDEVIFEHIQAPIFVEVAHGDAGAELVMRRDYLHAPDKLWDLITQPDLLAHWSPIVPDRVLNTAGSAVCRENPEDEPNNAEVLEAVAPQKLIHHWGDDVVTWTISPTESGASLELRQSLGDEQFASMLAAGWQVCLGRLAPEEDGVDRERVVGQRAKAYGWEELNEHYQKSLNTGSE